MDKVIYSRTTYSLLEWLGDVGGVFDALYLIFRFILAPIAAHNMSATLMSHLIRERPSDTDKFKRMDTTVRQD